MEPNRKLRRVLAAWAAVLAAAMVPDALAALGVDTDGDGMPDGVEVAYGRDVAVRDNDVFGSSELFSMQQYRDFLRREADSGGLTYYTTALLNGTTTRAAVINGFIASPEFEGLIAPIARLYIAFFRRTPDFGGLMYQADLSAAGVPLEAIAQAFSLSPEFQATYGALDNTGYVNLVYQNVLNRAPDPSGFAFYKAMLDSGTPRGTVMLYFSESPENRTATAARVQVTMLYAGMLQRSPEQAGLDYWIAQIQAGASPQALIASFMQGAEYHTRFLGADYDAKSVAFNAKAARVLNTTTFGQTQALVARVRDIGPNNWVESQLYSPVTVLPTFGFVPNTQPSNCVFTTSSSTPESLCERDNYTLYLLQNGFFLNALGAGDQLRHRVAFALSQIFVTSGNEVQIAYAMRNYQQKLVDGAFGNFEDLMYNITVDPVMGRYLDMANNDKPNASGTVQPNENYARELMQLFTLGVWMLNDDGSLKLEAVTLDAIPTYDQADVIGFARVFTGWTWPTLPGGTPRWTNPGNYNGPMVPIQTHHDVAQKVLLNVTLPPNQAADVDLRAALHDIFMHPNVGPFIGRQLIQHLVTANPSPAYVARVTAAFNNNGFGVRGDLRTVIRAIVLDPEALGPHAPDYGKLKEPVVFVASLLRALNGTSDGLYPRQQASNMNQNVYYSPSVFNYYPADYIIPTTDLDGPTFGIWNATTIFTRANFVYQMTFNNGQNPDPLLVGAIGTRINLAPWQPLATNVPVLVDTIGELLLPGQMTPVMRNAVITAVTAVSATSTLDRVRTAVYLIASSPRFQLEH